MKSIRQKLSAVSLKHKLTGLLLGAVIASQLSSFAGVLVYEFTTFQPRVRSELVSLAEILSENMKAPLAFASNEVAQATLRNLSDNASISAVWVYRRDGGVFARYSAQHARAPQAFPEQQSIQFASGRATLTQPIVYQGEVLGYLAIERALPTIWERLPRYWVLLLFIGLVIVLLGVLVAAGVSRLVTRRLKGLALTAEAISTRQDYSLRAQPKGADEIGVLARTFNRMLDVIAKHRNELQSTNERLDLALVSSNAGTWRWDLERGTLLWDDALHALFGIRPGAFSGRFEDFLQFVHPEDRARVDEALNEALHQQHELETEFRVIWPDLSVHTLMARGRVYLDSRHEPMQLTGVSIDVTARKQAEERLAYLAKHDPLTGLVNRREFEARLARLVDSAQRKGGRHALLYLDLDRFKVVNDTCGHSAGDELLRQLTHILKQTARQRDTFGRIGGDEFGVLLEHCDEGSALRIAHGLRQAVQDFRFVYEGHQFALGASIGLVPVNAEAQSAEHLLHEADSACYAAKRTGRNRVHLFDEAARNLVITRGETSWMTRIIAALEHDHFVLMKHPITACRHEGRQGTQHVEILLRIQEEGGELMSPSAFLPIAERYNLMGSIDKWVIEHLFAWLAEHRNTLNSLDTLSVNLSGSSLDDEDLPSMIREWLQHYAIPADKVCFEITETVAVMNLEACTRFMRYFKELGCRFSLDDFGTGFASYGYLKELPVDYVKIDGVFVKDIHENALDYGIVESINKVAHLMGKRTIAEFVESEAVLQCARRIGVDYVQGMALSEPLALNDDWPRVS